MILKDLKTISYFPSNSPSFSNFENSTRNLDMQELDYNPSRKDLTDARIHHLLAEELKPYRRVSHHRWHFNFIKQIVNFKRKFYDLRCPFMTFRVRSRLKLGDYTKCHQWTAAVLLEISHLACLGIKTREFWYSLESQNWWQKNLRAPSLNWCCSTFINELLLLLFRSFIFSFAKNKINLKFLLYSPRDGFRASPNWNI